MTEQHSNALAAVYVQTNDATNNEVLAFERRPGGKLAPLGRFATGGQGTGQAAPAISELDRSQRRWPAAARRECR